MSASDDVRVFGEVPDPRDLPNIIAEMHGVLEEAINNKDPFVMIDRKSLALLLAGASLWVEEGR